MSMSKDTGIKSYYLNKIEALEQLINDKSQNLKRLEAQRNDLNNQGPLLSPLKFLKNINSSTLKG